MCKASDCGALLFLSMKNRYRLSLDMASSQVMLHYTWSKPDWIWNKGQKDKNMFVCLLAWDFGGFLLLLFWSLLFWVCVFFGLSLQNKFFIPSVMKKNHLWRMNIKVLSVMVGWIFWKIFFWIYHCFSFANLPNS